MKTKWSQSCPPPTRPGQVSKNQYMISFISVFNVFQGKPSLNYLVFSLLNRAEKLFRISQSWPSFQSLWPTVDNNNLCCFNAEFSINWQESENLSSFDAFLWTNEEVKWGLLVKWQDILHVWQCTKTNEVIESFSLVPFIFIIF